ncbi:glycosyltransferase [Carboxydocella sp. ULO1]|uniref:glycosyltransferase n=1 Tax=Carboxydocella sp. ULO1 TaxID=1926599 RepID=UPI0009CC2DC0|nr:glycosyltransferase [Carboxydocella sp. ULO1]GAW29465.1 hypothetical protein ULO1_20350 [Carboxydocella sp. ULO1]
MNDNTTVWDNVFASWDPKLIPVPSPLACEFIYLFKSLVSEGACLLEVGSGSGEISAALAQNGYECTLLDASDVALNLSKLLFENNNCKGNFVKGDLFNLPFPDESFDIVWNSGVLEHFDDVEIVAALREMRRVSRKFVVVAVPNASCVFYRLAKWYLESQDKWEYGKETPKSSLKKLFRQAGFSKSIIEGYLGYDLGISWINRLDQIPEGFGELIRHWSQELRNDEALISSLSYLLVTIGHKNNDSWLSLAGGDVLLLKKKLGLGLSEKRTKKMGINSLNEKIKELQDTLNNFILERLYIDLENERKQNLALQKELGELRVQLTSSQYDLFKKENEIKVLAEELNKVKVRLAEIIEEKNIIETKLETEVAHVTQEKKLLEDTLKSIYNSRAWKALTLYRKCKYGLLELFKKKSEVAIKKNNEQVNVGLEVPLENNPYHIWKYDILCFPIIDWGFRYQRPQQLMTHFADKGYRIFYFTTTFNLAKEKDEPKLEIREIRNNVWEVKLSLVRNLNIYKDSIDDINLNMLKKSIFELRKRFGILMACSIVDLPFWGKLAFSLKEEFGWKVIYDCMDQHSGFSTNDDIMLRTERELTQKADLVITTSKKLFNDKRTENRHTILIPNAGDFKHFSNPPDTQKPDYLSGPVVGYYGAISDWFDVEIIRYSATKHLDWNFLLIGSTFGADIEPLKGLKNVFLLGEKPYAELPMYLSWFDVATIPFKINELTLATNPVKFFEYIAMGKPVVSIKLPELEPYAELVYLADNKEEFDKMLELAIKEKDIVIKEKRISLAKENTWEKRCELMEQEMSKLYPLVSIIIVTFNNLSLTKQCIDSIFANTLYPNFEIIIIDNNSNDGTKEYLKGLEATDARVTVILNEKNYGFAKANNQGLKIAKGEFLVLLNNDTIVSRGWLDALVQHAKREDVGLVGPVTNSIGNQAKIEVDYKSPSEVNEFAWKHCSKNKGIIFDIPMLAMYCVVMRREVFEKVGFLDESFELGMFEDDDYSHRVKLAGYRVVCAEDAFVHHFGGASFGKLEEQRYKEIFEKNKRRFEEKWKIKWKPHSYR